MLDMTDGDAIQLIKDVSENTYNADSLRKFESLAKHQLDVLKLGQHVRVPTTGLEIKGRIPPRVSLGE